VDHSTWTLGLGLGPTTTPPPVAAGATQVCCYGCQRPGIHRKNCPTCYVTDCGTSALNGFCTLNVNPMVPRRSPTVSVSISGVQESAIVDTVACYSVASAGLDKHSLALATGHPTQKVIVKATRADNDAKTISLQQVESRNQLYTTDETSGVHTRLKVVVTTLCKTQPRLKWITRWNPPSNFAPSPCGRGLAPRDRKRTTQRPVGSTRRVIRENWTSNPLRTVPNRYW
jgi:hypothetical protein